MKILLIVFWISGCLIIYSTVIYFFLLKLFKQNHYKRNDQYLPSISIIICAYNEEKSIASKLQNTWELDYPLEKMQIIVADDGSTDKTVEITNGFDFVEILKLPRAGKTSAQNEAVKIAENDILIFSDANNTYKVDALKKLVRNFADERVGVVCGELQYNEKKSGENFYWEYEVAIKKKESKNGWLLGANGSIYAVLRKAFVTLPEDSISDHLEPIMVYSNGLDVIYEPEAIAIEDVPDNVLHRKRRIILRSLVTMKYVLSLLNPFKKRSIFIPYVSHKLIRWFLPFFLMIIFFTTCLLMSNTNIYSYFFTVQIIFYLFGWLFHPVRYFIKVNLASLLAVIDWLTGRRQNTWDVVR